MSAIAEQVRELCNCGSSGNFHFRRGDGPPVPVCWECFERDEGAEKVAEAKAARDAAAKFLSLEARN